jgi:hypothetical protein
MGEVINKRVCYLALWSEEVQSLVFHLEATGFKDQDLLGRLKEFLEPSVTIQQTQQ